MARSNRQLTQFAVNKVRQFLTDSANFKNEKAGNTRVSFHDCNECPRKALRVCLFDHLIMELVVNPLRPGSIVGLLVRTGDFYDSKGRPSRTTRERLNGLLDALGEARFIPEGVRIFLQEDGTCCLGKGSACKPFDQSHAILGLLAHPTDLVFA